MKIKFWDGLKNCFNSLVNKRNALKNNIFFNEHVLHNTELRAIYKTGIGSKIVRTKSEAALKKTLDFKTEEDEEFYNDYLAYHVKLAARFMLAFGRGIIVIIEPGADPSQPLPDMTNAREFRLHTFSGDDITSAQTSWDLENPRYYKPLGYQVRGHHFHYSRVIDFTYVEPTEQDAPNYYYGGIPEFELIYNQLVSDQIISRAVPSILEKSSTIFYKLDGFKEQLATGQDSTVTDYVSTVEQMRSIYGAGIADKNDEIETVTQSLQNLSETDQISLRRIAMVTGIPLSVLVGESVRGLNSTGENELSIWQNTLESLQDNYLIEPINQAMQIFGYNKVKFSENQSETAKKRIDYEAQAIDNATKLADLSEDHGKYLEEKGIIKENDVNEFLFNSQSSDDNLEKGDQDGEGQQEQT
jgi:hypothetical protein